MCQTNRFTSSCTAFCVMTLLGKQTDQVHIDLHTYNLEHVMRRIFKSSIQMAPLVVLWKKPSPPCSIPWQMHTIDLSDTSSQVYGCFGYMLRPVARLKAKIV